MTDTIVTDIELLDLDALVAPISPEQPAGDERAYVHGLRDQLLELRREERAEDFDDAMRPAELKRADWEGVVRTACEALQNSTKDLRVVCHLIEAETKLNGFQGLRIGLRLLRRLIEECWDHLNPSIADGDLEARAAPLANMLDDPQRGICFPLTVQMVPLIGISADRYGLIQWQRAKQSRDAQTEERLARAAVETPISELEARAEAIQGCLEELDLLLPALDEKLGPEAPALTNLRSAIEQCNQLVREGFLQSTPAGVLNSGPAIEDDDTSAVKASTAPSAATTTIRGTDQAVLSRSEAYNQLKRAAEMLEKLEPHSPIPYLVKRAVRLGSLPFPKLIEQVIRDDSVLQELEREFDLAGTGEDAS